MLNPQEIKNQFPLLNQTTNGENLVYFDNASTTPKPQIVIDSEKYFYEKINANVHRGVYQLSETASIEYEKVREICAKFINAKSSQEIVFVKNATEAANLIAKSLGNLVLEKGDNVIVTELEHHANFLPWLEITEQKSAEVKILKMLDSDGTLQDLEQIIDSKTKILAITQMSNVLGVMPDLAKMIEIAKKHNLIVVLDAAQGISHLGLDVQKLDLDFAFASGHKLFAPMGTGFLYGKSEYLEKMEPLLTGGGMIKNLEFLDGKWKKTWLDAPAKFEAGTPNVAGIIAMGKAIQWLENFSKGEILQHDQELRDYAILKLSEIEGVTVYGKNPELNYGGIVAFSIENAHPHDIATIFSNAGICIRAGHHCAKPLLKSLKLNAVSRMSFHLYNDKAEIDLAIDAVKQVKSIFG